ncbi:NADH dehydrogenase 1 alpha subcomplex assembly factor 3 [Dimargaris cristalligena]|uniref:NADH dehydrogenase 1 alpha subcomplex assembly factor 3 n=1 Tax=Dimargaris cristalligena TaxID=215637 RepID=A0A4P9ZKJ4_9FUNG|nr:NADH dehydrogenase 1 alpha subcomplex assembly factor 3 [Dimargaris cristalligena]|eukprot:RKP33615.1 NADH dehydrogenase 1 alpha subcomplex assembly factor 3 [Dimargaris cristalligena]
MGAEPTMRVQAFTPQGFIFTNGVQVNGPTFIVGSTVLEWKIQPGPSGAYELTEANKDIWKILEVVTPKPEILVVGTGRSFRPLPVALQNYLRSLGIRLEVTDTVS